MEITMDAMPLQMLKERLLALKKGAINVKISTLRKGKVPWGMEMEEKERRVILEDKLDEIFKDVLKWKKIQ